MNQVADCVKARHYSIYERAQNNSKMLLDKASQEIDAFFKERNANLDHICFVAVGSVGRQEALEASDLDIVPVAADEAVLISYLGMDADLRAHLRTTLNINVSKGEDLTKATCIPYLIDRDTIGGGEDTSGRLTKRVLL